MKLSPRACVGLVLLLWLCLGSWISYDLHNSREREQHNAARIASTVAKTLEGQLQATIQKIDLRLIEFITHHRQAVVHRIPRARVEPELASYLSIFPEAVSFRVADATGNYLYDATGTLSSFNVGQREYFLTHRDNAKVGLFISEPFESKVSGDWVIVMSRRIEDDAGQFVGIIIATIRGDFFEHFYSTLDVGSHGMIALWGDSMKQAARWPQRLEWRGKTINSRALPDLLAAGNTSGTLVHHAFFDGVPRLYAYRKMEGQPFVITVGIAEEDYLAEWRKRALTYIVFGTLLAFALAVLIRNWSRGYARAEAQAKLMTEAFLAKEREGRALLDAIPAPAWLIDTEARVLATNDAFCRLFDRPMGELLGQTTFDLFPPENAARLREAQLRVYRENAPVREELWLDLGQGRRPYEFLRVPVYDDGGQPRGLAGVAWDVSARYEAEQRQRLVAQVFDNSNEGLLILDPQRRAVLCNRSFEQLSGYRFAELEGQDAARLASPRHGEQFVDQLQREVISRGYWRGEVWMVGKGDHPERPLWCHISAVKGDQGALLHFIVQAIDLTERKAAEARIESLSTRDQLTGLPNRQGFAQILDERLRDGRGGAVLMFDLDSLGRINDAFGHEAGDILLRATATRLRSLLRDNDVVGRLGSDNFGVLIDDRRDSETIKISVRKLLDAIAAPLDIGGHEVVSTACAGICLFPDDGTEVAVLLRNAASAMHSAKVEGQNQFHFFASDMNRRMAERLRFESDLRTALDRDELLLYYQPQIDLATGRLSGFESLLRWRHPELGLQLPDRIIPVAEESRLILPIGEWALNAACRQARAWQDAGLPPVVVAVNLSALQLHDGHIVEQVRSALALSGLEPRWLELEITESATMQDPERVVTLLAQLKELGVRLAIDDFGTGYSSLAYLKRFPLDKIKIDRSFVTDIESDINDASIVRLVIGIAKDLGLKVIAEGVETVGQREFLLLHQCDEIQGYLFSRPLPADAVPELLRSTGTV